VRGDVYVLDFGEPVGHEQELRRLGEVDPVVMLDLEKIIRRSLALWKAAW